MFKKWFSKKDKTIMPNTVTVPSSFPANSPIGSANTMGNIILSTGTNIPTYTMNSSMITGSAIAAGSVYNTITSSPYQGSSSFTIGTNLHNSTSVVTFYNQSNTEIVRLNRDGTITWGNGIDVNEAAEAFARSISLGGEMQSGITQGVKHRMRDSVFADLIEIAKEKGSLTADDLTYLLEASKIVEKLKGGKE